MSRRVTLLLVGAAGEPLGRLPPIDVEVPWWPEAAPIVDAVRDRDDLEATVLRLIESPSRPHGGAVTYVAEVVGALPPSLAVTPPTDRDHASLVEHPLRQSWARPSGPAAHVRWAIDALGAQGRSLARRPRQVRTWNLSTLWQLPTDGGDAWLKVVPPFFAHEGAVIEALGPGAPVPRLLAHDGPRMLVDGIPGDDLYDAPLDRRLTMVDRLVALQASLTGRLDELAAIGVPDRRSGPLSIAIADVIARVGPSLTTSDRQVLETFVDGLDDRWRAVEEAGLPDTLVHGDFHPGNLRGTATALTILDWGDSHLGHPLLDEPAMALTASGAMWTPLRDHWHAAWRRHLPGSDPARASHALAPIGAARLAVIYQGFLDRIEPSERPYHAADPAESLRRTAQVLRAEAAAGG